MNRDRQTCIDARRAPIHPDLVAAKLAAVRNYEYPELMKEISERPRLVELLWFIQAMSLRPGGLCKFAENLVAEFPERLGTRTMLAARGRDYTLQEKLAIWEELPDDARPDIPREHGEWSAWGLLDEQPQDFTARESRNRKALREGLKNFGAEFFRSRCMAGALEELPEYLLALCIQKSQSFGSGGTWYFRDIMAAIFEFMDRWAAQAQKRLAMTQVAKLVFDRLEYALAEKVMVTIAGGSRFGKTEAMETWCDMRPGVARLVRVPCDNSMHSFLRRIAEALGIDWSYSSAPSRLKDRIEYITRHGDLFLVFDEASFLLPQNYSETTPPQRLNWVRTEIVDRHLPCALAFTPQAFKSAVDRFVKKTRYTMEQFFGRDFLPCVLPDSLSEADLIAVARIHFPEMTEDALGYIANEARLSQNYLQAVEGFARRARDLARRRKGQVCPRDLQTAVAEVLSRRQTETLGAGAGMAPVEDGRREVPRVAAERTFKAPLTGLARRIQAGRTENNLPPCSLGDAGPTRTEVDHISAEP